MITFSIMLITSILTSALTTKEKLLTKEANERGKESQSLYMLSSKLSDAADMEAVLRIAAESISHLLQVNVGCIYVGRQSEPIFIQQSGKEQIHRSVPDADEIRKRFGRDIQIFGANIWKKRKLTDIRSMDENICGQ